MNSTNLVAGLLILDLWSAACGVPNDTASAISWHADLTIADLPFNALSGGHWPSMAQSRSITASFFELTGSGIDWATGRVRNPLARCAAIAGLEGTVLLLSTYLPGGETWMHEEYHRAVLSNRGIDSYNSLYDFNVDISDVSVSHIADDALVQLKAQHPDEFVRLESAGYEAQVSLVDALLKDALFYNIRFMEIPALYTLVSNTVYLAYCTTPAADAETRAFNATETSIANRDAIGWDYTAWSYDLHRPDEPYTARGVHPSGVGINRYILWTSLTPTEKRYLRLQAGLSLVNLVRPQLYGLGPLRTGWTGHRIAGTLGLEHNLTPFGFELGLQVLAKTAKAGYAVAINSYSNSRMVLPGIDCEMINLPIFRATGRVFWSPRIALWLQPKDQRFETREMQFGILAGQRLGIRLVPGARAFVDLTLKSRGWVAGIEELEPAARVAIGGELLL